MDDRKPSDIADRVVVRTPEGMRERLNELARVNGRSANAEAVKALEAWLLPGHQTEPAFVRLTDELWHKVSRAARDNKRGVVDEILVRLAATFDEGPNEGGSSLRAEIRSAMHEAVEDLLSDPERLRRLGYKSPERG